MSEPSSECGLPIGSQVLTPSGPVAVETLAPGAIVLAVSGIAAPFQPVVAVRRFRTAAALVRLRAESLDEGAPQEDLLLPAGHALLIQGRLIAAGALVDGHGIIAEPAGMAVELVAVTLVAHDALLVAGAAVESARPDADAPDCAPRGAPDGILRASLSFRAEQMGWAAPMVSESEPEIGSLRDWLEASPLAAALPLVPPVDGAVSG